MEDIRRTVGAYRVLLTVNPLIEKDLRGVTATTKELLADYSSEYGSTLFSSEDAAFIELRHDFKFKGGTRGARGPAISIKCFDAGLGFLRDLFFDFTERSLASIADAADDEVQKLKTYYEKLRKINPEIDELAAKIKETTLTDKEAWKIHRELDRTIMVGGEDYGTGLTFEERREILKLETLKKIEEREEIHGAALVRREEIMLDIQSVISQKTLPKVFIMYGTGDDLHHWAGPFESYLGEVKHTNDGKDEVTEFIFTTDLTTEQFEDTTLFDISKKSEKIEFFKRVQVPVLAYNWSDAAGREPGIRSEWFKGHPNTFHECIVKLISNYLFHIGIKNNLVVLPNLDSVLGSLIENCVLEVILNNSKTARLNEKLRKHSPSYKSEGGFMAREAGGPRAPWRGMKGVERQNRITAFVKNLFGHADDPARRRVSSFGLTIPGYKEEDLINAFFDFWPGVDPASLLTGGTGPVYGGADEPITAVWDDWDFWNRRAREVIMKVFNGIGASYNKVEGANSKEDGILLSELNNQTSKDLTDAREITMSNVFDPISTAGGGKDWTFGELKFNAIVKLTFQAAKDQKKPLTDWFDPLQELIDGINGCAGGDIIYLHDGYETDAGASKILRSKFGGGTFLGYVVPATTLAVPIDATPTYLFGDRELIRMLVYGEFYKKIQINDKLKDHDYLADKGDFITGVIYDPARFPGGFSHYRDPFWRKIGVDLGLSIAGDLTNYFRDIWDYLHPLGGGVSLGYFNGYVREANEISRLLPDEFGYSIDPDTLDHFFEQDYPLFLANTNGANVLSYSFDVNKFLYGSLFGSIQEIYFNVSKRYLTTPAALPLASPTLTKAEYLEKIKEIMDSLRARTAFTGTGLSTAVTTPAPVDLDAIYDSLAHLLYKGSTASPALRTRKGRSSSIMAFLLLFLDIFERQYIGTIKTLPFFEHSQLSTINKTALGIIKSTRRLGPETANISTGRKERHPVTDYLSGFYRIIGFQHVISGSDAYSEFSVVKDIIGEFNNES